MPIASQSVPAISVSRLSSVTTTNGDAGAERAEHRDERQVAARGRVMFARHAVGPLAVGLA